MSHFRSNQGLLAIMAALLATSPNLHAAEWVAEPYIGLRTEYEDNPRLLSTDADSVWGVILDPRLKLSRRTEALDLSASGRIRASRYDGQEGLDTTDDFLNLMLRRRFERGSFDARASQVNDTTLQNETVDIDTGLTIVQIDRTRRNLTLSTQYMLTETTWVQGSFDYTTLEYDDSGTQGLFDYDYFTPTLQLVHQLDAKTQLFGVYSHSKVDYDRDDNLETTTDSLQLGAVYNFTETWRLSGSAGYQRTTLNQTLSGLVPRPGFEIFFPFIADVVYVPGETETTGLVYNVDLSRKFETGDLIFSASRSIEPSSDGTSSDSTSLSIGAKRRFSAKLSGQLAVSYLQSEDVGSTITALERERYRVTPSLAWQLDRDLALNAGYIYRRVERSRSTADSNVAYIGLAYTWPRMAMSR